MMKDIYRIKLNESINKNLEKVLKDYYILGQASVIAVVLKFLQNGEYKLEDLTLGLEKWLNEEEQLKNFAYECMKDY